MRTLIMYLPIVIVALCALGDPAECVNSSRLKELADLVPVVVQGGAYSQKSGIATTFEIITYNALNFMMLGAAKCIVLILNIFFSPASIALMLSRQGGANVFRDAEVSVEDTEFEWMLQFMRSANSGNWTCLQKLSCEYAESTHQYVRAGRIMLTASRMASTFGWSMDSTRYDRIVRSIEAAAKYGTDNSAKCAEKYHCTSNGPDKRVRR